MAALKSLFLFTDTNQVRVLAGDGVTMTTISASSRRLDGTRPVCGCIHDRLWGGAGHFVYLASRQP